MLSQNALPVGKGEHARGHNHWRGRRGRHRPQALGSDAHQFQLGQCFLHGAADPGGGVRLRRHLQRRCLAPDRPPQLADFTQFSEAKRTRERIFASRRLPARIIADSFVAMAALITNGYLTYVVFRPNSARGPQLVTTLSPGASRRWRLCFAYLLAPLPRKQLPAVSAVNGKFEFDAGALSLPSPGFMGRAAGTLTVPIGAPLRPAARCQHRQFTGLYQQRRRSRSSPATRQAICSAAPSVSSGPWAQRSSPPVRKQNSISTTLDRRWRGRASPMPSPPAGPGSHHAARDARTSAITSTTTPASPSASPSSMATARCNLVVSICSAISICRCR